MAEVKNYAVIDESGTVINVIAWCGTTKYNPGEGLTLIQSDTAGRGDTWDGTNFIKRIVEEQI